MQLAIQCKLSDFLPGRNAPLIAMLHEIGVPNLDLEVELASVLSADEWQETQRTLETNGLRAVSVHVPCLMKLPEWSFDESGLEQARLVMDRAKRLRAEFITFVVDPPPPVGMTVDVARRHFEQGVDLLLPEAEQRGLHSAFYNPGSYSAAFFGQAQYLQQLCEKYSPRAKLTFDIGNWVVAGELIENAVELLAPWISVVHIKDWTLISSSSSVASQTRSGIRRFVRHLVTHSPLSGLARAIGRGLKLKRFLPTGATAIDGAWYQGAVIGDGFLDHRTTLSHLKQVNFTGYVCVEYEGPENHVEALRRGARVVQGLLRELSPQVASSAK